MVVEYLKRNPSADNELVIKDCHCSTTLVSRARRLLREQGIGGYALKDRGAQAREARLEWERKHQKGETDEILIRGTEELMDLAAKTGHMNEAEVDPKEFLKTLVGFIRDHDLGPALRMAAMQQYTKIKADLLGRDSIGPGDPLTVDDQRTRLSMLMKAVGLKTAVQSMELAFPKLQEAPDGETNQAESPVGTTEAVEPTGHTNQEDPISDVRPLSMEVGHAPESLSSIEHNDSGEHTP